MSEIEGIRHLTEGYRTAELREGEQFSVGEVYARYNPRERCDEPACDATVNTEGKTIKMEFIWDWHRNRVVRKDNNGTIRGDLLALVIAAVREKFRAAGHS